MSSWALLPGMGAGPHRARMGSDVLLHGPCCYMRTPPVGASRPSRPVNGSQRLRDRPLSLGSRAVDGEVSPPILLALNLTQLKSQGIRLWKRLSRMKLVLSMTRQEQ